MDKLGQKAQNVVSMSDFKPETGYAALAQVEAYWEALRGERLLPKRSEIDPRGIENALENAFILERVGPGIARLRIAGTHLSDLMGMEVRGMPLTSLFAPATRRQVSDVLEEVFQIPAAATLKLFARGAHQKPGLEARMLLLPLKSDLGDVSRALGCLVSAGEVGLAPRRFEVLGRTITPISTGTPKGAATETKAPRPQTPQPNTGFADPAPDFKPAKSRAEEGKTKRPPYLRLIKSDDDT